MSTSSSTSQPTLDATITVALAEASIAAYAAYKNESYTPPTGYTCVDQWTGWDAFLITGTEEMFGLVFQSAAQPGTFIFAFRGTDSDMDIYEDVHFETVDFVPSNNQPLSPTPRVAGGFYGIYDSLGGSMTVSMRTQLFALLQKYNPTTLYVTGHSLGAALSQLFSLDLAVSQPSPSMTTQNINFSSPMVGTADWQTAYQNTIAADASIRCYNYWDYVPALPPSDFGYLPVGAGFRTAFYVQGEWFPHELSRHSIKNLNIVLGNALPENPQVWQGTFQDQVDASLTMQSDVPPAGADVQWADKAREVMALEQSLRVA